MFEGPKLDVWRARLEARGHQLIAPDPATYTTVAVEPDPVLRPQYRDRFFLCEPEPKQVFRVLGCPEPHRGRWVDLVSRQQSSSWRAYLAGPGSWLLARLTRFREVVAWSEEGLSWQGLHNPRHRGWGVEVPDAASFFAAADGPEAGRPRLMPVNDPRFADAVAACVSFASLATPRDCFLADAEATEVYLAHHHRKVAVFIPDPATRELLLRELREATWLFSDVSGYESGFDQEGGP